MSTAVYNFNYPIVEVNRTIKKEVKNFTQVSNYIIDAKESSKLGLPPLKPTACRLLEILIKLMDNWRFSISDICERVNAGKTAIRNAMNELIRTGYLKIIRYLDAKTGKFISTKYFVSETAEFYNENQKLKGSYTNCFYEKVKLETLDNKESYPSDGNPNQANPNQAKNTQTILNNNNIDIEKTTKKHEVNSKENNSNQNKVKNNVVAFENSSQQKSQNNRDSNKSPLPNENNKNGIDTPQQEKQENKQQSNKQQLTKEQNKYIDKLMNMSYQGVKISFSRGSAEKLVKLGTIDNGIEKKHVFNVIDEKIESLKTIDLTGITNIGGFIYSAISHNYQNKQKIDENKIIETKHENKKNLQKYKKAWYMIGEPDPNVSPYNFTQRLVKLYDLGFVEENLRRVLEIMPKNILIGILEENKNEKYINSEKVNEIISLIKV